MKRALAFVATGLLLSNPIAGAAASQCASSADQAALKTAAVQQQLMVAALSCHDVYEYNRFVLGHRSELINSDDALKAYFQKADKLHGTATYNKYKTELANAASLRSSREPDSFCNAAAREFDSVLRPASLATIVASADLIADAPGASCPVYGDNRPTLALATRPAAQPPRVPDGQKSFGAPDTDENWDADEESNDSADYSDDAGDRRDFDAPRPHHSIDDDFDH
jgi:hypothetical protein